MTPDEASRTIASERTAILAMRDTEGGPDLPRAVSSLARAHLVCAFAVTERKLIVGALNRASDLLEVLVSLGRRDGHGTELFLDDDYAESFVPRSVGPHPWSTTSGWIDAFDVTVFVDRSENYEALVADFDFASPAESQAVRAYATSLCRRAAGSHDDYDGPIPWLRKSRTALASADVAVASWLRPRLDAWDEYESGQVRALSEALVAIAEAPELAADGVTVGVGASLAASAILAYSEASGLRVPIEHPSVRRIPQRG